MFALIRISSTIVNQIRGEQCQDPQYESIKQKVKFKEEDRWKLDNVRILNKRRLWVPENLWKEMMKQAHESSYTMHLGATKMYQDLKINYW